MNEEDPVIESPVLAHRSSFAMGEPNAVESNGGASNDDDPFFKANQVIPRDAFQEMFECRITNLVEFSDKKNQAR